MSLLFCTKKKQARNTPDEAVIPYYFSFFGIDPAIEFQSNPAEHFRPEANQLARYYTDKLNNRFYGDRMDGITGLGHLGKAASGSVPTLIAKSKTEQNNFYRLLALWSLAKTSTPDALSRSRSQAEKEKQHLLNGRFPEVAARTALLASIDRSDANLLKLNGSLPSLYNKARDGNLTEKLIASWALYEIGTPITKQAADRSMTAAAKTLSPDHGNYTRHLRYIRLVGSSAHRFFASKLRSLLKSYDFKIGLTPKRALTSYTLATITYPGENPVVNQFLKDINSRMDSMLDRDSALDDVEVLGPFACSQQVVENLRKIAGETGDQSDKEQAKKALGYCR